MTKKSEAASKEVAELDQGRIDRVIWRVSPKTDTFAIYSMLN